jgi:hypothetical protein
MTAEKSRSAGAAENHSDNDGTKLLNDWWKTEYGNTTEIDEKTNGEIFLGRGI